MQCAAFAGDVETQPFIFTITPTVTNHGPYPHPKPHNKVGRITAYVRGETKADADEARVVRKRKAKERYVPH
jgi:hypothetical protein